MVMDNMDNVAANDIDIDIDDVVDGPQVELVVVLDLKMLFRTTTKI